MTWIGNPTMWWRTSNGRFKSHILTYGMKAAETDELKALREAEVYAKEHHIKHFVVSAFGYSISTSETW